MSWLIDDITLKAGRKTILSGVSAPISTGKLTCLLGPNGAGKSSLLKVMVGEHKPTQGNIWFEHKPLSSYKAKYLAKQRAVLPQSAALDMRMTAVEVVMLGRMAWDESNKVVFALARQVMHLTDTMHLADRMANVLSGGEQMRVNLARCLLQIWSVDGDLSGRWLLLDEPLAPLDIAHQLTMMRLLKRLVSQHGLSVVMTVHDLNIALHNADEVLLMSQGKMHAFGCANEVLVSEHLDAVYGVRSEKLQSGHQSWLMFDV